MAQKYQNIPVKPETYAKVKMIADANDRGLGDQVSAWVEAELPECDHKKQQVSIEIFSSSAVLSGREHRKGWYCATCHRVYEYIKADAVACNAGADL